MKPPPHPILTAFAHRQLQPSLSAGFRNYVFFVCFDKFDLRADLDGLKVFEKNDRVQV